MKGTMETFRRDCADAADWLTDFLGEPVYLARLIEGKSQAPRKAMPAVQPQQQPTQYRSQPMPGYGSAAAPQAPSRPSPYSRAEIARHNTPNDCWVIIHNKVYDLTRFANAHPGGAQTIYPLAGQDGTAAFLSQHNDSYLSRMSMYYLADVTA